MTRFFLTIDSGAHGNDLAANMQQFMLQQQKALQQQQQKALQQQQKARNISPALTYKQQQVTLLFCFLIWLSS